MLPNEKVWYSGVNNTCTPRAAWRDFHRFKTNIYLLSDVMHYGSPNFWTYPRSSAWQQLTELSSAIGKASIHLEVLSMTVRRYGMPFEIGRGPNTSTCRSLKQGSETGLRRSGGWMDLVVFLALKW